MYLPIWIMLVIIIIFIVIYFIVFRINKNRLRSWEDKAGEILNSCGYNNIIKPKIYKHTKSYVSGRYNKQGITIDANIYLKSTKSYKDLIKMLAYIVTPKSEKDTITYHKALEKISFCCYNKGYIKDPFI
jgi:hypothetical protein